MTTSEALYRDRKRTFANPLIAKQMLQRAVRQKRIQRWPLFRNKPYYLACNDGGVRRPLSEVAKIRTYAMLAFCCLQKQPRRRLTDAELHKSLGGDRRLGLPRNFYVEPGKSGLCLGFLRVDLGGRARWDRILAKAKQDASRLSFLPALAPLIQNGMVEVRIATALPHKAARLRQALGEIPPVRGVPIRAVALPELINLIAPLPNP